MSGASERRSEWPLTQRVDFVVILRFCLTTSKPTPRSPLRFAQDSLDGSFHRAVLEIHKNNFPFANYYIDAARDILDTDLTAMVGESYQRAYGSMVTGES